jgi:hypothetical protein
VLADDLDGALQRHLNEEQFRLEKELLALQQRCGGELAQARGPRVSRALEPKRMAPSFGKGSRASRIRSPGVPAPPWSTA